MQRDTNFGVAPIRDGALLAANEIEVTFIFPKRTLIPTVVPEFEKSGNAQLEVYKQTIPLSFFEEASKSTMRRCRSYDIREEVVVASNVQQVHAGFIRKGLQRNGFVLTDLFFDQRRSKGGEPRFGVVAVFRPLPASTPPEFIPVLPQEISAALRSFADMTWNYANISDKKDGVISIVFSVYMKDDNPLRAVVVRNGKIEIVRTNHTLTDQEEMELSHNPAFEAFAHRKVDTNNAKVAS